MDKMGHSIAEYYRTIAKKFMSELKESKFYEKGILTPKEYEFAGDFLSQKCPTWKWCSAKTSVDYLPQDKQYLMTTVRCPRRAIEYVNQNKTTEVLIEDDWVEANANFYNRKKEDKILDIDEQNKPKQVMVDIQENYLDKNTDIDIVVDESENNQAQDDKIEIDIEDDFQVIDMNDNIIKTRTYDVSVTYDFFYQVPRMWLTGYGEDGGLLSDEQIKEDIMIEYTDKTVTIEPHPHTGVRSVSIHPCKHSHLLLRMIEQFENAGKTLEVWMSILLFLKFLHSVVPTIEYDFTMDIDF
jgi:ubiquitin-like-conjugating enzyme ATG3